MDTNVFFWFTVPTMKYRASVPRYVYICRVSTFLGSVASIASIYVTFYTQNHPAAFPHSCLIFEKWEIEREMPLF